MILFQHERNQLIWVCKENVSEHHPVSQQLWLAVIKCKKNIILCTWVWVINRKCCLVWLMRSKAALFELIRAESRFRSLSRFYLFRYPHYPSSEASSISWFSPYRNVPTAKFPSVGAVKSTVTGNNYCHSISSWQMQTAVMISDKWNIVTVGMKMTSTQMILQRRHVPQLDVDCFLHSYSETSCWCSLVIWTEISQSPHNA